MLEHIKTELRDIATHISQIDRRWVNKTTTLFIILIMLAVAATLQGYRYGLLAGRGECPIRAFNESCAELGMTCCQFFVDFDEGGRKALCNETGACIPNGCYNAVAVTR